MTSQTARVELARRPPRRPLSLACLLAEAELGRLAARLDDEPGLTLATTWVLDAPQDALPGEPGAEAAGRAAALPAGEVDVIVISDRPELIGRATAFAVIDLAFQGASVCTMSQLAAGRPPIGPLPDPRVVEHLMAAIVVDDRGRHTKRAVDLVVGGLALLLALPLFPLIAAAIRLDSPGAAFFVQERLGHRRHPFTCVKFRTMRDGAEDDTGPVWARAGDPRITRVGRLLRRSRLDELPQLLNVVRGEMSLVGTRPIRRHFADQLADHVPFYDVRFADKPGLTGWAQVHRNYASSFAEQIEKFYHDYHYIKTRSIALDLVILLRTALVVLRMGGT